MGLKQFCYFWSDTSQSPIAGLAGLHVAGMQVPQLGQFWVAHLHHLASCSLNVITHTTTLRSKRQIVTT